MKLSENTFVFWLIRDEKLCSDKKKFWSRWISHRQIRTYTQTISCLLFHSIYLTFKQIACFELCLYRWASCYTWGDRSAWKQRTPVLHLHKTQTETGDGHTSTNTKSTHILIFVPLRNRVRHENLTQLQYLTEVDQEGAQGPVHPITAVARVRPPHLLHPLERQQTTSWSTQWHKTISYWRDVNTLFTAHDLQYK